jgi:hypothetical protein
MQEIGATAFDVLHSMISHGAPAERDVVLLTRLILRESCGCPSRSTAVSRGDHPSGPQAQAFLEGDLTDRRVGPALRAA